MSFQSMGSTTGFVLSRHRVQILCYDKIVFHLLNRSREGIGFETIFFFECSRL